MNPITTFDIHKEALLDLLRGVQQGKLQLPDFQRSWVWEDMQVRSLLSSVSLAYPVGVVILLQLGNPKVRFQPRLIDGVNIDPIPDPSLLILDGQQRLTTLFQALLSGKPVAIRENGSRKPMRRWYYIDIEKALDAPKIDREEAILSLSEDRILRVGGSKLIDCSSPEQEYEAGLFPLSKTFDYSDWRSKYSKYWNYNSEKLELLDRFESEIIKCFEHYQVSLIQLRQALPKEAVCQVFEKVNSIGKVLTHFDLVTAAYAADDFSLREDWTMRQRRLRKHAILSGIDSTNFLQAVALIATHARRGQMFSSVGSAKGNFNRYSRYQILGLSLLEYKTWAEPITKGFEDAARLLHGQKIFDARDLPYPMQVVALAALFTLLGNIAHQEYTRSKLIQWFWCGVFGEMYAGMMFSRALRDLVEVIQWVKEEGESTTVLEANFVSARLLRLRSRQSAVFRGLCALLLQEGVLDFHTGEAITDVKYFDDRIDSHHIFPKAWCRAQGIDDKLANCVINRTLLSAKTNHAIGKHSPSVYLRQLEQKGMSHKRLNAILRSHLIEPETLWADDFEAFFAARTQALLEMVHRAMGKGTTAEVIAIRHHLTHFKDIADGLKG